jgi:hypothetical protein
MASNRLATFLLATCMALAAQAAAAQSKDALAGAQLLVVRSGLSVQLRGFSAQLKSQIEQQRAKLGDQLVGALAEAAAEAFRPEVLEADIVRDVAARLKVEEMNFAITWLATETGRRVTLAEEAASASADEAALRKYFEGMKGRQPAAARVALINEVIDASYGEDTAVRGLQAMALGIALGMDSVQPVERRLGLARIEAQVDAALPAEKVKEELRASMPASYLYTYRDISDQDLRDYVAFLRSPSGKRYSEQVTEAFMGALVRASVRLGQLAEQRSARQPA